MEIRVDFSLAVPIYQQIVDQLKLKIARDELRPGDRLPSVRDLALALSINPNTVSSAYRELMHLGLVTKRKGVGLFLAEGIKDLPAREKREQLAKRIGDLLAFGAGLGFTTEEIVRAVGAAGEAESDE